MYLLGNTLPQTDQLTRHLSQLPAQLLDGLKPSASPLHLRQTKNLFKQLPTDQLYLIDSGQVHLCLGRRPLLQLEAGDLIGLVPEAELPSCRHCIDDSAHLIPYERVEAIRHFNADNTRQQLYLRYAMDLTCLLSEARSPRREPAMLETQAGTLHVAAGTTLITQGDKAEHVFIIVEGSADVLVDGQKVGELREDEIFGTMALFTNERRSATVVAREDCRVTAIPQSQFLTLMRKAPQLTHSLIEDMSRHIDLLNKEVSQLRQQYR